MQKRRAGRDEEKVHNVRNIPMRLAGVLLVLTCVSTWMLSGLLARYSTESTVANAARVAAFWVEATGTPAEQKVDASLKDITKAVYEIDIENKSEVAVEYSIYVTFQEALPDWITVTLEGADDQPITAGQVSEDKKTLYFYEVGQMEAGGTAAEELHLEVNGEKLALSFPPAAENHQSSLESESSLEFEIYVNFVQID